MSKKANMWHRLVIHISGEEPERFINLCKYNHILLTDMYKDDTGIYATLSYKQWEEIKKFEKKCLVTCKIVSEQGILAFLKKYRKHLVFFICLLLFFGFVWYSSLFIWQIEVDGESDYTEEEIVEYVRENLIPIGTRRSKVKLANLEKNLRMQYDKVAWITCEIDGTRLLVHIVETVAKEDLKTMEEPCNIVAVKDGLVTDLIATSGKKIVNPGDEVKKGDILITGVVNVYNEYEELIETNYVPASGIVYGQTTYYYKESFPMEYTEKKHGKKKKTAYAVQIGSKIHLFCQPKESDQYTKIDTTHVFHLGSYYLPISLTVQRFYQPEYKMKTYTEEQAREKQNTILKNYMENLKKKGVEILENNVTIEIKNGECRAEGTLVVREILGAPEEFTIPEQPQPEK